jgi:hypothetical protein
MPAKGQNEMKEEQGKGSHFQSERTLVDILTAREGKTKVKSTQGRILKSTEMIRITFELLRFPLNYPRAV